MISLSLCMIVKNEEAVLERILKPVSQVMDAILIADTGSSDRTKEIAEQYTSQVFDFPWCDDFSAPRNFLLEKVSTDYWMWLDADDVLDEENLERLKSLKERSWSELYPQTAGGRKNPLPHMVEPGTGASQYPHQMGKERPGKRAVYVGLLRYQRPFDESRLHRGDCFPEKGLPLQNRHDWGKEAGGLDCGGGTA